MNDLQYKAQYAHLIKTNEYHTLLRELHRLIDLRGELGSNLNRYDQGLLVRLQAWYEEHHTN